MDNPESCSFFCHSRALSGFPQFLSCPPLCRPCVEQQQDSLQRQTRTKQNKKGPDLFAMNPDVCVEAVMPDMGQGPDAMTPEEIGVAYDVPVDPFILRVRSAFETKAGLIREYIKANIIQPQQATVIAIGGPLTRATKLARKTAAYLIQEAIHLLTSPVSQSVLFGR